MVVLVTRKDEEDPIKNEGARQGFFWQFWEGPLGPFRLGKLAWEIF